MDIKLHWSLPYVSLNMRRLIRVMTCVNVAFTLPSWFLIALVWCLVEEVLFATTFVGGNLCQNFSLKIVCVLVCVQFVTPTCSWSCSFHPIFGFTSTCSPKWNRHSPQVDVLGPFYAYIIKFGKTTKNKVIFMAIEQIDDVQLEKGKLAFKTNKCWVLKK